MFAFAVKWPRFWRATLAGSSFGFEAGGAQTENAKFMAIAAGIFLFQQFKAHAMLARRQIVSNAVYLVIAAPGLLEKTP